MIYLFYFIFEREREREIHLPTKFIHNRSQLFLISFIRHHIRSQTPIEKRFHHLRPFHIDECDVKSKRSHRFSFPIRIINLSLDSFSFLIIWSPSITLIPLGVSQLTLSGLDDALHLVQVLLKLNGLGVESFIQCFRSISLFFHFSQSGFGLDDI